MNTKQFIKLLESRLRGAELDLELLEIQCLSVKVSDNAYYQKKGEIRAFKGLIATLQAPTKP